MRWRPYQLDPTIPEGGLDRTDFMERKFGRVGRLKAIHDNLARLGAGGRRRRRAVRNEIAQAQTIGVTGVPFFIFGGRLGVPGAQDVAVLRRAMAQARAAMRKTPAA